MKFGELWFRTKWFFTKKRDRGPGFIVKRGYTGEYSITFGTSFKGKGKVEPEKKNGST